MGRKPKRLIETIDGNYNINVNIKGDQLKKVKTLMKNYPYDYPTVSDVVRGGINTLHAWKNKYEGVEIEEQKEE